MRRHDFDALSFISGLLFAGAGLVLLGGGAALDGLTLPWAGPIVAIGVAALIVIAAHPRAVSTATDEAPADPPAT
ncbi:MAG: hypothetical protein HYX54_02340 [Chloroflexi bacterium]|nr:hypothetical protein [Chloroflexota bacterium]